MLTSAPFLIVSHFINNVFCFLRILHDQDEYMLYFINKNKKNNKKTKKKQKRKKEKKKQKKKKKS